jgi:hypothetical protein
MNQRDAALPSTEPGRSILRTVLTCRLPFGLVTVTCIDAAGLAVLPIRSPFWNPQQLGIRMCRCRHAQYIRNPWPQTRTWFPQRKDGDWLLPNR